MPNEYLTLDQIAKESLMRLRNNLVFANLVHRDYSDEYASYGDKIQVKKPATFEAKDFVADGSTSKQDIKEGKVDVYLNKIADITVEVSAKELTLNIQDFGAQVAEGAMQAIAQKVDADLANQYKTIPYYAGDAGTEPATLSDLANARKTLNKNKAPMMNRRLVLSPDAESNLLVLDSVVNAEKSGTTQALREASLGKLMGFNTFMSQNIVSHTKGTLAVSGTDDIVVNAEVAVGASEIVLGTSSTDTLTGTVLVGDILNIDGNKYVATKEATANADATLTVKIAPATEVVLPADTVVTISASNVGNLAFHRNAFALVNRPMALPMGGAEGAVANFEGLSIRVTRDYTMSSKSNEISFDILYGIKTLEEKLATRAWGTSG